MITNLAVRPLLEQNPAPPVQGPEFGGSSPVALVVTLLLFIALIVLIRSMNKHLRKVPASFDPPEREPTSTSSPQAGSPGSVPGRRAPAQEGTSAGEASPAGTSAGEGTPASSAGTPGAGASSAGTSSADTSSADTSSADTSSAGGPDAGTTTDERG
jgi:hypothetical protein